MRILSVVAALLCLLYSCTEDTSGQPSALEGRPVRGNASHTDMPVNPPKIDSIPKLPSGNDTSELEHHLKAMGLVDIASIDTSIRVRLKYAEKDNFMGYAVYGKLKRCYMQEEVALKLKKAQEILQKKYPYYYLIVYDGVRPLSIQKRMWDTLKMPDAIKQKYVSDPEKGSLHNYGVAVDVSIVDGDGFPLDMGTAYDYFGELAHPEFEKKFLEKGELTHRQMFNRELLRDVMTGAGLMKIETEWWHFNSCNRAEAGKKYAIVE